MGPTFLVLLLVGRQLHSGAIVLYNGADEGDAHRALEAGQRDFAGKGNADSCVVLTTIRAEAKLS